MKPRRTLGSQLSTANWLAVAIVLLSCASSRGLSGRGIAEESEAADGSSSAKKPHVVFVVGDCEYRSEITMPLMARILEARHGMKCSLAMASPKPTTLENIEGLKALESADLAIFYIRYRRLPENQLKYILDYVSSGKPIIGVRTSSHAFLYPEGHAYRYLNDGFGRDVLGQKYMGKLGPQTDVSTVPEQASHPMLRGVKKQFPSKCKLYRSHPFPAECTSLLVGKPTHYKPDRYDKAPSTPIAWVKEYKVARVFFTTLGDPNDFAIESFRRLFINAVYWALDKSIPATGTDARLLNEYKPPSRKKPLARKRVGGAMIAERLRASRCLQS